LHFSQGQSSLLREKDGDGSEIFEYMKTRHASVLKTRCSSKMEIETCRILVRDNVFKICNEKKKKSISISLNQDVIIFKSSADIESVFEELGIDIADVKTSAEISEDQAVTAYLKQAARHWH
jgi:hypothetical protein